MPSLLRIQFQLIVDDQVCNNVSVSAQCYVIHLIMYRSGVKANRALLKNPRHCIVNPKATSISHVPLLRFRYRFQFTKCQRSSNRSQRPPSTSTRRRARVSTVCSSRPTPPTWLLATMTAVSRYVHCVRASERINGGSSHGPRRLHPSQPLYMSTVISRRTSLHVDSCEYC